jgi:ATP-dependent Clp protease protease subunit
MIDQASMSEAIAQILYFKQLDSVSPITVAVDSSGGLVDQGMALVDTIGFLKASTPVHTHCLGHAAGMALVIVASGSKGFRTCELGASFQLTHLFTMTPRRVSLECMAQAERQVAEILAEATGQPASSLFFDMLSERRFTAVEARAYGIVDEIVTNPF